MLMEEQILDSSQIYDGRLVKLRVDRVVLQSGRETTREVVEHPDCVAIIALDAEDNVILVRQFRHAVAKELLEVPAGVIEPGEEPLKSALRELAEESGYMAGSIKCLGGFYSSPGYSTEFLHLFLATELKPGPSHGQEDEIIEVVPIPLKQVHRLITSGEIQDAKSIAGLLALSLHQGESDT
jgi:ADP-ribose pyrophosphatase